MKTIYFKNEGLLDLSVVTTFGMSAKETEDPFGFFGTGLKYAIAILLREKATMTIWVGKEPYTFTTKQKMFRGKEIDMVYMNDKELSFTLELGKTWEIWQAFRELYCNTMDERGVITSTKLEPEEECTLITVESNTFYTVYEHKSEIILDTAPLYESSRVDAHLTNGFNHTLFYKTIRVGKLERPSIFVYNFNHSIDLTEDRTLANDYQYKIAIQKFICNATHKEVTKKALTASKGTFEQELNFTYVTTDDDFKTFFEVIDELDFKEITNTSAIKLYNNSKIINKTPTITYLNVVEKKQLAKAITFIKTAFGYDIPESLIDVSDELHNNVLGMVYEGRIYLSIRVFHQGTKQVVATLLEEWLHYSKNYVDETYEFQTFLFDMIISQAELNAGEPI